jgi:hypothetical protein
MALQAQNTLDIQLFLNYLIPPMATEYPPLGKSFVSGYSNSDRDFPIISIRKDPRVENYKIPEDLSPHPDSARYPNHVFTGAQNGNSDERVVWTYEILPAPWVPFTRYDDDLGPIQGRRRFVKNTGQEASLSSSTKISYEAREGSAIVSSEIEETWNSSIDDEDNSPFPVKTQNTYDERLGPIKETKQLFPITGNEVGSIVYNAPTITETSYIPYSQYLVYKVVRTYDLDGPVRREDIYDEVRGAVQRLSQTTYDNGGLVGSITGNETGITQTVYQPINTLVVDRVVESYKLPGPVRYEDIYDPARGAISRTSQIIYRSDSVRAYLAGSSTSSTKVIYNPINNLVVDSIAERHILSGPILNGQEYDESLDIVIPYSETIVSTDPISNVTGNRKQINPQDTASSLKKEYKFTEIATSLDSYYYEVPDLSSVELPDMLKSIKLLISQGGSKSEGTGIGNAYSWRASSQSSVGGDIAYDIQQGYSGIVESIKAVMFLPKNQSSVTQHILPKLQAQDATRGRLRTQIWPYPKQIAYTITLTGGTSSTETSQSLSLGDDISSSNSSGGGYSISTGVSKIPPTLHYAIPFSITTIGDVTDATTSVPLFGMSISSDNGSVVWTSASGTSPSIPATDPPEFVLGRYITNVSASPYRFGYTRVEVTVVDIQNVYTAKSRAIPAAVTSLNSYNSIVNKIIPPTIVGANSIGKIPVTATVGTPFSYQIVISGGTVGGQMDYTVSAYVEPTLQFNEFQNRIYGTFTSAGYFEFTIAVSAATGIASAILAVTVT